MNRYNLDSCDTLEPSFVEEKYSQFNIGVNDDDEENSDLEINDSPKKGSNRNKPFEINISFDQYRRNREYKGIVSIKYDVVCTRFRKSVIMLSISVTLIFGIMIF